MAASGTPKSNRKNLFFSKTPVIPFVAVGALIKKPMGFVKAFSFIHLIYSKIHSFKLDTSTSNHVSNFRIGHQRCSIKKCS